MNLTESLLQALKANGARQIFGIPGDFALPFFRIIEESRILPLYTLSHEPGVALPPTRRRASMVCSVWRRSPMAPVPST